MIAMFFMKLAISFGSAALVIGLAGVFGFIPPYNQCHPAIRGTFQGLFGAGVLSALIAMLITFWTIP